MTASLTFNLEEFRSLADARLHADIPAEMHDMNRPAPRSDDDLNRHLGATFDAVPSPRAAAEKRRTASRAPTNGRRCGKLASMTIQPLAGLGGCRRDADERRGAQAPALLSQCFAANASFQVNAIS